MPTPIERVRAQILAGLKFDEHDPETVASLAWDRLAFHGHPYGRPIKGTLQSIAAISRDDLKSYVDRMFARDKLVISVVGDIDAATLGQALDHIFGPLPARSELAAVADANPPLGPDARDHRDGRAAIGGAIRPSRHRRGRTATSSPPTC